MTAIVGFTDKKNNVTWIGSDSLGSNGFSKAVQANPKCFHNDTLKMLLWEALLPLDTLIY